MFLHNQSRKCKTKIYRLSQGLDIHIKRVCSIRLNLNLLYNHYYHLMHVWKSIKTDKETDTKTAKFTFRCMQWNNYLVWSMNLLASALPHYSLTTMSSDWSLPHRGHVPPTAINVIQRLAALGQSELNWKIWPCCCF